MKHSTSQTSQVQHSEILSQFREEIAPRAQAGAVPLIVEKIELWVGTQPELTHILCEYVIQHAPPITEEKAAAIVDCIVETEIVNDLNNGLAAVHFNEIEKIIVQDDRKDSALILYLQILQRGKVPVSRSPEQSLLVSSRLVKAESGYLKVANALYAKVFDLQKLEQMLPGITKPVVVISSASDRDRRSFTTSNLYPKLVVVACAFAVLAASISSSIRESGGTALATSRDVSNDEPALSAGSIESISKPSFDTETTRATKVIVVDRVLFDRGEDHAINNRWVLMMRDFCDIPETSMYFLPAKKQVEKLFKLYSEDIQFARDIVQAENGSHCLL